MPKVKFMPQDVVLDVNSGENLLEAARRAHIFIDAPCNGNGACGKCKVRIVRGSVKTQKSTHIDENEKMEGYVLACCSTVIEDVEVLVPESTNVSMHQMKIEDLSSPKDKIIFQKVKNQLKETGMDTIKNVKKLYIELDQPTIDDNISDVERIKRHLRNGFNYGNVLFSIDVLRKIPTLMRNCEFKFTVTIEQTREDEVRLLDMEEGNTAHRLFGIALDIGTTSVAASLIDLSSNEIIARASSGNAQIKYGADVINRIIFSTRKDGLKKLNDAVIQETINPLLNKMYGDAGINQQEVVAFVGAGNTTMSHLFYGVHADFLRMEPYIPAFVNSCDARAKDVGLCMNGEAPVYMAPSVASYVGGDITAGVLASGMWHKDENVLFIDLGTNGEIVFGNKDFLMTCACSAGPAFEGGEISCGMRAATGAIEEIKVDGKSYEPEFSVIGAAEPQGICGSGIIDLICELKGAGIIDARGKMMEGLGTDRVRFDEHGIGEYVIAFKDDYGIPNDVSITEVDIDSFIRAKGAIYSGINVLLSSLGMDENSIDKILIAGGIGNSLDIENAVRIGMLPDVHREKFEYIGNSSLMGAYLSLVSMDARRKLEEVANHMTYVELSVYPGYMDEFVSACFLPHTDIERFPSVKNLTEN